jgi:hypothetical protein
VHLTPNTEGRIYTLYSPPPETPQPDYGQTMRSNVLRNVLLNNPLTAAGETLLHLVSGAVAVPLSGLAGLATAAVKWDSNAGADAVRSVGNALTYEPRGEMGQAATELVNYPFEKLAEGAHWAGGKTLDATGSPLVATLVDTGIQAVPIIVGIKKGSGAFVLRRPIVPKAGQRIRQGSNGKVAVTGRDMNAVRAEAERLRAQGYDVEIFDGNMISEEANTNFKAIAQTYEDGRIPDAAIPETTMYKENMTWAQKLVDQDYTVLDIGNPTGKGPSPFYSGEGSIIFGDK